MKPFLEQLLQARIQTLALTLRPNTVYHYRSTARCFLAYLRTAFPRVHRPSQLHRDPHLLGWFRWRCEQQPPLRNLTRIHHLQDLQREFHQARQNAVHPHHLPTLSLPKGIDSADIPNIRQALLATRHLLEMYRRQLKDEKTKCRLQRLDRRLLAIASQLDRIAAAEK
jgi:hypothetical protein